MEHTFYSNEEIATYVFQQIERLKKETAEATVVQNSGGKVPAKDFLTIGLDSAYAHGKLIGKMEALLDLLNHFDEEIKIDTSELTR